MRACSLHAITNIAKFNAAWFSKFQIMRYVDYKMWAVECIVEVCFVSKLLLSATSGGEV